MLHNKPSWSIDAVKACWDAFHAFINVQALGWRHDVLYVPRRTGAKKVAKCVQAGVFTTSIPCCTLIDIWGKEKHLLTTSFFGKGNTVC